MSTFTLDQTDYVNYLKGIGPKQQDEYIRKTMQNIDYTTMTVSNYYDDQQNKGETNMKTIKDQYPDPRVGDVFECVNGIFLVNGLEYLGFRCCQFMQRNNKLNNTNHCCQLSDNALQDFKLISRGPEVIKDVIKPNETVLPKITAPITNVIIPTQTHYNKGSYNCLVCNSDVGNNYSDFRNAMVIHMPSTNVSNVELQYVCKACTSIALGTIKASKPAPKNQTPSKTETYSSWNPWDDDFAEDA